MTAALDALAGCALIILVVLAIRRPVARTFGARAAYALWLAPAARLAAPLVGMPGIAPLPAAGGGGGLEPLIVTLEGAARAAAAPPSWLLPAWLGGAALYLAARLASHHLFLSRALDSGRPLAGDYPFDLVATPAIDGPLATGLVHRLVLVPDDFEARFTPEQQRLALEHEALHHRRGDLWACSAALLITALNWFNPLAHVALSAFRRDMESACDAELLARRGAADTPAYAETLLRCAARPAPRSLCALTSIDELKGRLMMLDQHPNLARRLAGLGLAGLVAAAGLTLSLPASADPGPATETRKEIRIVEIGKGDRLTDADRADIEKRVADRKCPDGSEGITADSTGKEVDGKQEKSVILICTKGGAAPADAVAGLERALARIEGDPDMNPTVKAEISAKLKARIAELKAR